MLLLSLVLAAQVATPSAATAPRASIHDPFTSLLQAHVVNDLVDYDAFAKSQEFQQYLQTLDAARLDSMTKDERLAFWINAYNAYTIQLINRHKERESIRNINVFLGVLRGKRPWKEEIVRAAGRFLSLDDVLNKVIRADFKEPRVHMALVGAAMSSPPLRAEAYEGAKLGQQLDDQTRTFLKERQTANRLDLGNSIIHLSPIFDWNRADFGKTDAAILRFVAPYFEGKGEKAAFAAARLTIEFTDFDWALNIQKPRETQ
ncbi:MAG: DUF547 domain-containing protein [Vicinamibacteria bacterium]|nr:DUF547 domain-containing protein [Vicinamibacteria bacterium]